MAHLKKQILVIFLILFFSGNRSILSNLIKYLFQTITALSWHNSSNVIEIAKYLPALVQLKAA